MSLPQREVTAFWNNLSAASDRQIQTMSGVGTNPVFDVAAAPNVRASSGIIQSNKFRPDL